MEQGIRLSEGFPGKMKLVAVVDTLNFNKIVDFVMKHGFPKERLLGEKNAAFVCVQSAIPILLHNPHRLVNEQKYFNLFLNEEKKVNLDAAFYATILDKYYWIKSNDKETRKVFLVHNLANHVFKLKKLLIKHELKLV